MLTLLVNIRLRVHTRSTDKWCMTWTFHLLHWAKKIVINARNFVCTTRNTGLTPYQTAVMSVKTRTNISNEPLKPGHNTDKTLMQTAPMNVSYFRLWDLEKVVMLQRLNMFKSVLFARRIIAFNESFVPVGSRQNLKPLAVLWHEAIAGRKREDIISAFHAFFATYGDIPDSIVTRQLCSPKHTYSASRGHLFDSSAFL